MTEADGDPDSAADRITGYALDGLVTLLGLSRDIGIHSDLDTLLQRVEAAALRVLDCERLTVFLNEPLARELRSRLATGTFAYAMGVGPIVAMGPPIGKKTSGVTQASSGDRPAQALPLGMRGLLM